MKLLEFGLLSFSSMFVIIDPIAVVPTFLAITAQDPAARRIRTAGLASVIAALVLVVFAIAGQWIFKLFGITLPAFQIAGSIVLMLVALDIIKAKRSDVKETIEDKLAGEEKDEVAVTPLGVPMLAGPGAISTAILLQSQTSDLPHQLILYLAIIAACFMSYLALRLAVTGSQFMSPIIMRIAIRLMGLILGAIAVQFMINALKEIVPKIIR